MADLLSMSADIIDGRVTPEALGPLNRINHQLSELATDLAVVEAFSHCIVFKTDEGLVTFDTSNEHGGKKCVSAIQSWTHDPFHTVVFTHGHIDHAGGATELSQILNIEIHGPHIADKFLLDELQKQGEMFGLPSKNCIPDKWLDEGNIVEIGNEILEVYLCPGHTPGHIIFFNKKTNLALVGDVLFSGSIGRTDLPGGNFDDLINSVKNKLYYSL